jgi:outer membrane lipoprotein-sorting protein
MKEHEPNFEDERIRAWLRKPKDETWERLDKDPTVMTIDEETEEIFESRTYRLRPTPEASCLVLDTLRVRMGEQLEQMPAVMLAQYATSMVEDTMVKFLAKRHKEDGRIAHLLEAVTDGARRLLHRRD